MNPAAAPSARPRHFEPFAAGHDARLVPKPELEAMVVRVFRSFNLVGEEETSSSRGGNGIGTGAFNITHAALARFVREVCALYNDDLAFHNFHHAFTVFAVSAEIVRAVQGAAPGATNEKQKRPPLQDIHVLAILLAALCHDVDHPGLSNAFLNSTRAAQGTGNPASSPAAAESTAAPHRLVARHGGETTSVVEAHHVELTTRLLHGAGIENEGGETDEGAAEPPATTAPAAEGGLLSGMAEADAAYAMQLIEHAIMGTDLAVHKRLTHKLETLGKVLGFANAKVLGFDDAEGENEQTPGEEGKLDDETLAARIRTAVGEDFHHVVVQAILHAADLSNPTLDFRTCAAWSLRLCAEFDGSAAREAEWKNNARATTGEETTTTGTGTGTANCCYKHEYHTGTGTGTGTGDAGSGGGARGGGDRAGKEEADDVRKKVMPLAKSETWFVENLILPYWSAIAVVYPPLQRHAKRVRETAGIYAAMAAEHERA